MAAAKRATAALVLAAAFALGIAPAAARRPLNDPDRNTLEAVRALHDFGQCAVRDHWGRVQLPQILAMDYRSDAARDALRGFVRERSQCVAPEHALSSNLLLFAGALAEAMLPRDRPLAELVAYDPARPALQARDEIEVMSLCAVRAGPAEAVALFATVPGSNGERAALRAIAPRLGQCLRSGQDVRVNGLEVRALLALAAWRLGVLNGLVGGVGD